MQDKTTNRRTRKGLVIAFVAFLVALALAVGVIVLFVPTVGGSADVCMDTVVDLHYLRSDGRIVFFDTKNGTFVHEEDVTDFVEGDPLNLLPGYDVFAIYAKTSQVSGRLDNVAILSDGSIVQMPTAFRLLPRCGDGGSFSLTGDLNDLSVRAAFAGGNEYSLFIRQGGSRNVTVEHVSDAWVAYDTVYWLVGDRAYKLEYKNLNAVTELYAENAYGISHHSDEAEGALVPQQLANASYYGRDDIISPYPTR